MKRTAFIGVIVIVAGSCLALTGYAQSASPLSATSDLTTANQVHPRARNPEASKRAKLTRLRNTVALTADQENKAQPIISKYVDDLQAVRDDSQLQPKERRQKLAALRRQYQSDLDGILTEEQRQKLATIKAERLAKRRAAKTGAVPNPEGSPEPSAAESRSAE